MNTFKAKLLTNWHIMRVFRLGIGIWLLVMAIQTQDWATGLFSAFFLYQAVTDTGCCGTQSCYAPQAKQVVKKDSTLDDTEYEEIK